MPVVVLAPELAAILGLLVTGLILLCLVVAWRNTIGYLLERLAVAVRVSISVHGIGFTLNALGDAISDLDNSVRNALAKALAANQYALNKMLAALAATFQAIGESIEWLAQESLRWNTWLVKHYLPNAISAALGPISAIVYNQRKRIEHFLAHLAGPVTALIHRAEHAVAGLLARIGQVERSLQHAIGRAYAHVQDAVWPRIHGIEHDLSALRKWIRKHAKRFTVAGSVGLVAAVLGKLGLGWTRCSKVGRVGKALCRADESWIEGLIAGSLIVAGGLSLVELAEAELAVTGEIAGAVAGTFREFR